MKTLKKVTQRILVILLLTVTVTTTIPSILEKGIVSKYSANDDETDLEPYKEETIPRT